MENVPEGYLGAPFVWYERCRDVGGLVGIGKSVPEQQLRFGYMRGMSKGRI